VAVHVLPTGAARGRFNDPTKLRYGDLSTAEGSFASAFGATQALLANAEGR